jgi:hypothetical protein
MDYALTDRYLREEGTVYLTGVQALVRFGGRLQGHGERCALAHIEGKKRCCACNEIKLLEKEFGTDRTARDGHARAARCATPQPEQ